MKKKSTKEKAEEIESIPKEKLIKPGKRVEKVVVTPKENRTGILSIRMDPETLRGLEIYARKIGEKPSAIARDLIKQGLAKQGAVLSIAEISDMLTSRVQLKEAAFGIALEHYARVYSSFASTLRDIGPPGEIHLNPGALPAELEEHALGAQEQEIKITGGIDFGCLANAV